MEIEHRVNVAGAPFPDEPRLYRITGSQRPAGAPSALFRYDPATELFTSLSSGLKRSGLRLAQLGWGSPLLVTSYFVPPAAHRSKTRHLVVDRDGTGLTTWQWDDTNHRWSDIGNGRSAEPDSDDVRGAKYVGPSPFQQAPQPPGARAEHFKPAATVVFRSRLSQSWEHLPCVTTGACLPTPPPRRSSWWRW